QPSIRNRKIFHNPLRSKDLEITCIAFATLHVHRGSFPARQALRVGLESPTYRRIFFARVMKFIEENRRMRAQAMTAEEGKEVERRLEADEKADADIQRRLSTAPEPDNWLERVIGSISDAEAFDEALNYGREVRHADRPADEDDERP